MLPGDGELRGFARRAVGSYYHPAGTCRMGTGPDAVVDPQLRVHGVAGLRVADASVMPTIPNAPLNATVLAIAERAAALIAGWSAGPGRWCARPGRWCAGPGQWCACHGR